MKIIMFAGKKGAGKTTYAQSLLNAYPRESVGLFRFAAPLKEACEVLYGTESFIRRYGEREGKETVMPAFGRTPRELMQRFGDMMKEEYGQNFWTRKLIHSIKDSGVEVAIIDDVRYLHEFETIEAVFLPEDVEVYRVYVQKTIQHGPEDTHSSETGILHSKTFCHLGNYNLILEEPVDEGVEYYNVACMYEMLNT